MSKFDELLGELETLAKAQPADGNEKIEAAAAEGDGGQGDGDGDKGKPGPGDGDGDGDDGAGGEVMGKSFEVTLPDGTKMQAQDGTELVKALNERIDEQSGELTKAMTALEKAVGLVKSLSETVTKQGERIQALSGEGRGRKAVLTVVEKPAGGATMAKSEPDGMKPEEFMAKALDAQKLGRITGLDVALAEASLNRGQPVPANIIANVMKA